MSVNPSTLRSRARRERIRLQALAQNPNAAGAPPIPRPGIILF